MGDISIAASVTIVLRTFPFLILRIAVYLGLAAAFVVAIGGGAGIGLGLGSLAGSTGRAPGAFWGAICGFAFVSGLLWWLREYFLYFVEVSHATALSVAVEGARLPAARGQISAVMTILQRRFREARALLAAERLTQKTIGELIADAKPLASVVPSGINLPENVTNAVLSFALGFVGKALLGRAISHAARNPYAELQDSLTRLAQENRILLRNAILLATGSFAVSFVIFLLSLVPASAFASSVPSGSIFIVSAIALAFAWAFRQAILEPLIVAAFLELFRRATEGRDPDPAWDARLTAISQTYREIRAIAAPPQRGQRRGVVA